MFGSYFYHSQIRRTIAVFGTLFNNINIRKTDSAGKILQDIKVPLAYGPRQKFLARVQNQTDLNDAKLAIKLPRMSFEITSITYDTNQTVNKSNEVRVGSITSNTRNSVRAPAPYRVGIQLNIMAKNQDEALQILEQILPTFKPDYTVTINEVPTIGIKSDIPIVLQGVSMNDDYEGDFITRRAIIYTLDFETRVNFYGEVQNKKTIRKVVSDFFDFDKGNEGLLERQQVTTNPATANVTDTFTYAVTYPFPAVADNLRLVLINNAANYNVGETVAGTNTGATATVKSWDSGGKILLVANPTAYFEIGERVTGATSGALGDIQTSTNVYV
ncbi:MAG: hypothetical protein CMB98_06860 [Flavobacteriaceae bacterium]|nr:hypothetical protein [Flavobacteriaceae bacterium]|tara:strand:- start:1982 stop:2971 length:990 start_codon:yes stop_codon:yes gene_type:complete